MKYFSFKILILCILLPSILYVFSIQLIESHLQNRYLCEIEEIYTGGTQPLFDGTIRLKDAVGNNIDRYLQNSMLISWGIKVRVTVATKSGTLLYPAIIDEKYSSFPFDSTQIAADNYNLLNEGLVVSVDLKVGHNTLFSNSILAFYIFLSVFVLYIYYRAGAKMAEKDDMEKRGEIERLLKLEKNHADSLSFLSHERETLLSEVQVIEKNLENAKQKAGENEEEMIQDIVVLEEKIEKNLGLQDEQQKLIDSLEEKIKDYEREKIKDYEAVQRRFRALYKNVSINKKAVNGFLYLTDDLKIKSEEIIHQINENPQLVSIKRKVFGRKNMEKILEVIFAYKGRLYFRKQKSSKIEILTIGTKNTQTKDLEFLSSL
ncbi:MAG: hypothetical protein LWW98_10475 [Deltaproteobacteria bacterium]|nr:hypothetical protein [Deltaproteobacteria bacterium]